MDLTQIFLPDISWENNLLPDKPTLPDTMIELCLIYTCATETMANENDDHMKLRRRSRCLYPRWGQDLPRIGVWRHVRSVPELSLCAIFTSM